VNAEVAPRSILTGWVAGEPLPEGLTIGDECELKDAADKGAVVKCQRQELLGDEIGKHLEAGKQVSKVYDTTPGRMLIGAFIVGPPLPNFDLEREKMRDYYEENYAAGFDYAYTYPAMAKAVQAAGRVIRSETDQGIIVLMDNRFIQPSYVKSMPQDWYQATPHEMVSQGILKDVADFWNGHQTTEDES